MLRRFIKAAIKSVLPNCYFDRVPGANHKTIAVTFDDGPHPQTPEILSILNHYQVPATFFIQGVEAEKHQDIMTAYFQYSNYLVANHGYTHDHVRDTACSTYVANVDRCQAIIDSFSNKAPRFFRPPYGEKSICSLSQLMLKGYQFAMWSHDSMDSYHNSETKLTEEVLATHYPAGAILLFHEDYPHTLAALPKMIEGLQQQGYQFINLQGKSGNG